MRIGIFGNLAGVGTIDQIVADVQRAHDQGFATYWVPQIFGYDALTLLAMIGRETEGIELATAVVPTYPRHPAMLAAQAVTTQVAADGRFTLGIGLSHQPVIEMMFGMSFEKPARHMREYLDILMPLVEQKPVSASGETLSANVALDIPGAQPVPVLVAALGPKMLELAGARTSGTITWMTGAKTLESHTGPVIRAAAEAAGNAEPRVAAGIPVCVTDDADAARELAAKIFAVYGTLPSYRAMLDREGLEGPADLAIVGDEATVEAGIRRFADAGVTDFAANEFGTSDDHRARTRDVLRSLL